MTDKRTKRRIRKRVKIRFGENAPEKMAYTGDISDEGMFINTVAAKFVHGRMHIEITTPDGQTVLIEGRVRWAKRVPASIVHKHPKAGVGIQISRFIAGEEAYRKMLADLKD